MQILSTSAHDNAVLRKKWMNIKAMVTGGIDSIFSAKTCMQRRDFQFDIQIKSKNISSPTNGRHYLQLVLEKSIGACEPIHIN